MPYVITTAQVRDGFTTSASDADLTAYIAIMDQADACLTANGVADVVGQQLKILGVRHLASDASDGGDITQERAVSGAQRTYAGRKAGSTASLDTLRALDQYGCVVALVSNGGFVQLRAAGRYEP